MSRAFDDAVAQLSRHCGVTVRNVDGQDVHMDVEVPLPSRARLRGVSATGVKGVEPCVFRFSQDWPLKAPLVLLRTDFPLDLPHINPHRPGDYVNPCLFEGSLDDILHRFGLDKLVDQLIDWLRAAAAGQLIDLSQGWEPTRRDSCDSHVVFSAETAIAETPLNGAVLITGAKYIALNKLIWAASAEDLAQTEVLFSQNLRDYQRGKLAEGILQLFFVRAVGPDGEPAVIEQYQPESVFDMPSLLSRAQALGIDDANLEKQLNDYYLRSVAQAAQDPRTWTYGLYAIVIFLVGRPAALIGSPGRSVEALPYLVKWPISDNPLLRQQAEVSPAFHIHALSPELLAIASGMNLTVPSPHIVVLGCGSLGSKIALHLGRAGFGNMTFVDSESFSPHNNARHALITPRGPYVSKAVEMQNAFRQLSHSNTKAFDEDAVPLLFEEAKHGEVFRQEVGLVIDATASLRMLEAETLPSSLDSSPLRLARSAMFGQGRCISLLLEGEGRTVRVDDLTALLFNQCRFDRSLRSAIAGDQADAARVFVGDNCRSLTTPMPDSTVSRAASMAAEQILQWLSRGVATEGQVNFGIADKSGIGMQWSGFSVAPTMVLRVSEDEGWEIRVLAPLKNFIEEQSANWGPRETGGALLGHIDMQTRTIILAGWIDAPPDSVREPTRFVLGTQGLVPALKQANEDSVGYLMFVGTWHSHPMGGKHSGLDRETLAKIAHEAGGLPAVSLVWSPDGFFCAVGRW